MQSGKHLTTEGLEKVINLRASLNKGLSATLKEAFPNSIPFPRPLGPLNNVKLQGHCLAGLLQVMAA